VRQLDNGIQGNASAAEEMASTSEELSSQAQMLAQAMTFFKVEHQKTTTRTTVVRNPPSRTKALPKSIPPRIQAPIDNSGFDMDLDDDEFERF
jgi:methyl-accepting chemotaxis protein